MVYSTYWLWCLEQIARLYTQDLEVYTRNKGPLLVGVVLVVLRALVQSDMQPVHPQPAGAEPERLALLRNRFGDRVPDNLPALSKGVRAG